MSREIMQQAYDALKLGGLIKKTQAIAALEAELAKPEPQLTDAGADTNITRGLEPKGSGMVTLNQPKQEPVAWMLPEYGDVLPASQADGTGIYNIPLYTAPPRKEWVGLTDDEILECQKPGLSDDVYKLIEAKLRERNI
jgi:hypothetical protein